MDKHFSKFLSYFLFVFIVFFSIANSFLPNVQAEDSFLTKEENLWLESRNNTIVIYPEKGFPPFSYQSSSGIPQGLSIDYIELVAEKLGIKTQYLPARSRAQILEDIKQGKGDVLTSVANTTDRQEFLYFTDDYISVSTVMVVRKDLNNKKTLSLADLAGKKVAVGAGYAVSEYLRKNYPRIILDQVTDDEVALQQVVLGEVDVAIMDIASLSFYLSKQVLNSVKVVGNAGYEYKLAFAVPKEKQILQSILDKGLLQISQNERQIFNEKWIVITGSETKKDNLNFLKNIFSENNLIIILISLLIIVVFFLIRVRHHRSVFFHKAHDMSELKEDLAELEEANELLSEELHHIKDKQKTIHEKIHNYKSKK